MGRARPQGAVRSTGAAADPWTAWPRPVAERRAGEPPKLVSFRYLMQILIYRKSLLSAALKLLFAICGFIQSLGASWSHMTVFSQKL